MREGFVGVHIGAGQHAESRTQLYLSICSDACREAIKVLRDGGDALEAACRATMVLEDAGETNAGYGSNLTESGTVEMDAGIMDGNTLLFGAVGAMPGIKNPIHVAKLLVQEQQKGLLPLGRVPPGFLVGQGAHDWAVRHGATAVDSKALISEKANKLYSHYIKKLDAYEETEGNPLKRKNEEVNNCSQSDRTITSLNCTETPPDSDSASCGYETPPTSDSSIQRTKKEKLDEDIEDEVTDTVGVVIIDSTGRVVSTVSSGGIALKKPGRIGQASCYGCGCWAQKARAAQGRSHTVGISTTGCGEHLVRTFLARECAIELNKSHEPIDALTKVMKEKFAESEFLYGVPEKLGGAICMHYDENSGKGEFLWTHTTSSMGIAFQTTADEQATTRMSRKGSEQVLVDARSFTMIPKKQIICLNLDSTQFFNHNAPLQLKEIQNVHNISDSVSKISSITESSSFVHATERNKG